MRVTGWNGPAMRTETELEGPTIDGIAVTDLLAYWRAGHGANGA